MSFDECLMKDLENSFLNTKEFGEKVVLTRSGEDYTINGLFTKLSVNVSNGGNVNYISHQPTLTVRLIDLPGNAPRKSDVFSIFSRPGFHSAATFISEDFSEESDGTVIYKLHEVL